MNTFSRHCHHSGQAALSAPQHKGRDMTRHGKAKSPCAGGAACDSMPSSPTNRPTCCVLARHGARRTHQAPGPRRQELVVGGAAGFYDLRRPGRSGHVPHVPCRGQGAGNLQWAGHQRGRQPRRALDDDAGGGGGGGAEGGAGGVGEKDERCGGWGLSGSRCRMGARQGRHVAEGGVSAVLLHVRAQFSAATAARHVACV